MGLDLEALKKFQSTVMDSLPGKYTITTVGRLTAAGQSFDGIFERGRLRTETERTSERRPSAGLPEHEQPVVIVMAAGTNVVSVPHQSGGAATAAHSLCLINSDCRFSRHYSRTANI